MTSLGFDTIWVLPNLGSLQLFLGVFPLIIAIYLLMTCLAKSCAPTVRQRQKKMRSFVFWRWPLGFLKDNYTVIAICSMYNMRYASWGIPEARLNSTISLSLLILLSIYPFAQQAFLYIKRRSLSKKAFQAKYGVVYKGLHLSDKRFLYQPLFYYARRMLVPMSVVFYPKVFILHYSVLVLTGLATIVLIGIQRPFGSNTKNNVEILEETVILVIMYHIFCFTDWMPDLQVKHALGYSVTVCVLLHLFTFLGFDLGSSIKQHCRKLKKKKLLRKAHKHAEKQKLERKPAIQKYARSLKHRQAQLLNEQQIDKLNDRSIDPNE